MKRDLWFLNRHQPQPRTWVPAVSGASGEGDDDDDDDDSGDPPAGNDKPMFTAEQQRHIDKAMGAVKHDAKVKAEAEYKEKLERDRLAQESKFKELYEKADAELSEFKPKVESLEEQVKGLEEAVAAYVEPQLSKLDKLTQSLIRKQPVLEQLQLLAENATETGDGDKDAKQDGDKGKRNKPRVPASPTGRREKKDQPLAFEHVESRQNRVVAGLKDRVGSKS